MVACKYSSESTVIVCDKCEMSVWCEDCGKVTVLFVFSPFPPHIKDIKIYKLFGLQSSP